MTADSIEPTVEELAQLARLDQEYAAACDAHEQAQRDFVAANETVVAKHRERMALQNRLADRRRFAAAAKAEAERARAAAAYPQTRAGHLTEGAMAKALDALEPAGYGCAGSVPLFEYDVMVVVKDGAALMALYRHLANGGDVAAIHARVRELELAGAISAHQARSAADAINPRLW